MRQQYNYRQRGSMVIYLIAVLAVLGVISIAATSYFSASSVGTAHTNCNTAAQYLAESGMRYGTSEVRAQTTLATLTARAAALNRTYTVTNAGTFTLTVTPPADTGVGFYTVTIASTGTACVADGGVSDAIPPATIVTNIATVAKEIDFDSDTGSGGLENFDVVGAGGHSGDTVIIKDVANSTLKLGNNKRRSYACIWYAGNDGTCEDGDCDLGSGFRAYFELWIQGGNRRQINRIGDGFTFVVASKSTNGATACGGARGELLAYAGPGISGKGIQPPKLALEFDLHSNTGSRPPCRSNSRKDANNDATGNYLRDHLAWIYWGDDRPTGSCDATYDDNRHGEGDLTDSEPRNPANWSESGEGFDGYYYRMWTDPWGHLRPDSAWLRGYNTRRNQLKKYLVRVELDRSETPNAVGNYCYTLKGWAIRDNQTPPAAFRDLEKDYHDPTSATAQTTAPMVSDSFVLNTAMHKLMKEVQFGWTVATDAHTMNLEISKFKLRFREDEETCTPPTKPTDYVAGYSMFEGAGATLHDLSANGNNGTVRGATWVAGKGCPACSGLLMNAASGGQARIPHDNSLNLSTAGTISCWIYMNSHTPWGGVIHKGDSRRADWLGIFDDETYSLQFTDDQDHLSMMTFQNSWVFPQQSSTVTSQTRIDLDKWYHIVATWDDNAGNQDELIMYVNGVRDAASGNHDLWHPRITNSSLTIGAQFGTSYLSFDGIVDEVYIYDRAITPDEVRALYNDGLKKP